VLVLAASEGREVKCGPLLRALVVLVVLVCGAEASAASSGEVSPIRVGIGDQSAAMFTSPLFHQLHIKRTRYFVPSNIMHDREERLKARRFVQAARGAGVSTLVHVSTTDLRAERGRLVSVRDYRRDIGRIVMYFRELGVTDFGAWNEANHRSQETWNRIGHAVSYFRGAIAPPHTAATTAWPGAAGASVRT